MKSDTAHASGRTVRRRLGTKVPRDGKTEVGRKISKLLPQVDIPKYGGAEIVSTPRSNLQCSSPIGKG